MKTLSTLFILLLLLSLLTGCGAPADQKTGMTSDHTVDTLAVAAAKEAYIFGLPLILMDLTMKNGLQQTSENVFTHHRTFPDHTFRDVVRPNADTYYSTAILNLHQEPLVLRVPNTNGRYYLLPILDAYSNVFASPGTRTTGNEAKQFFISGPGWKGNVPEGMEHISSPTAMAWLIGRTQVNSKADGEKVVYKIQDGYTLTPLSSIGKNYSPPANPTPPPGNPENPNNTVKKMALTAYFNTLNQLMVNNPPAKADQPLMDRLARIGIAPGAVFDSTRFSDATYKAMQQETGGLIEAFAKMPKSGFDKNGWQYAVEEIGTYGTNYGKRAYISLFGLGANLPEDAVYPSATTDADGQPFDGNNQYLVHFTKDEIPPVHAFWSLTAYDQDGFFTANPLNRYAIGDRDKLKFNKDGSLDLYLQNTSPGKANESNWLPVPKGSFNLLLRLYWPKEPVIKGTWTPPAVKKVK